MIDFHFLPFDCIASNIHQANFVMLNINPLFLLAKCKPDEFQCFNYECIPDTKVCDGVAHCQDRSDEYHCCKYRKYS